MSRNHPGQFWWVMFWSWDWMSLVVSAIRLTAHRVTNKVSWEVRGHLLHASVKSKAKAMVSLAYFSNLARIRTPLIQIEQYIFQICEGRNLNTGVNICTSFFSYRHHSLEVRWCFSKICCFKWKACCSLNIKDNWLTSLINKVIVNGMCNYCQTYKTNFLSQTHTHTHIRTPALTYKHST